MADDRVIERDDPLLGQLHDRRRDERLGDRGHVEQRLGRDWPLVVEARDAEPACVDHRTTGNDADSHSGNPCQRHHLLDKWREPLVECITELARRHLVSISRPAGARQCLAFAGGDDSCRSASMFRRYSSFNSGG